MGKTTCRRRGRKKGILAAGKKFRLPVEPGRNALLTQKTFDEKRRLSGEGTGAKGPREGQLTLVGDFLNVHAPGLGVIDGKGEPAFPIVHAVVRAVLLLGIGHGLGESPDFPLEILRHTGRVKTDVVLADPGDHIFGTNDS
jgi:hypothetical protein